MQKVFTSLYQGLMSFFHGGKTVNIGTYRTEIFNSVGWMTLVAAIVLVIIFYYVFNKAFRSGWSRPMNWFLVLLLAAGAGATIAIQTSLKQDVEPDSYLKFFIVVNSFVGAVWFFLFSVLFKKWSAYARTTPFTGPF